MGRPNVAASDQAPSPSAAPTCTTLPVAPVRKAPNNTMNPTAFTNPLTAANQKRERSTPRITQ